MPALDPASLVAHRGFVRALAYGVLGRDDLADDAAQDAFVAALASGAPAPRRLPAFLATLVRRRAVDVARRAAARARHEAAARRPDVTAGSVDDVLARAELGRAMAGAVLALASPYREAVLLRYYEALPPRAIAARLGVPVDTARTHVRRGLEHLRATLDADRRGRERWMPAVAALLVDGGAAPTPAVASVAAAVGAAMVVAAVALAVAAPRAVPNGDAPATAAARAEPGAAPAPWLAGTRTAPEGRPAGVALVGAEAAAPRASSSPSFGVVVVDTEGPVRGARVTIGVEGADVAVATTAKDGTARVAVPHAGRVAVRVEADGYAAFARRNVRLDRGATLPWRVALERGTELSGRVVDAATGAGVAGAEVVAYGDVRADIAGDSPEDAELATAVPHVTARTRTDGGFRLVGVVRGWTQVAATADGYARAAADVRLGAGASPEVELALRPGGQLDVEVVDARGGPVPFARVTARVAGVEGPVSFAVLDGPGSAPAPVERETSAEAWAHAPLTAVADPQGRARIVGVPFDLPVSLLVRHPTRPPSPVTTVAPLTGEAPRRRVHVALPVGTSLRIVPLGPDGAPVAIRLHRQDYFPEPLSPDDGTRAGPVTLRRLPAGRHTLRLLATGLVSSLLEVDLVEGVPVEREVRFSEGATVEGRLVDERGLGLPGRTVTAWAVVRGEWSQAGVTAADGTFRIGGLVAGGVRLAMDDPTSFEMPMVGVVAPVRDVLLRVRRKAVVAFRLEVEGGLPLPETVFVAVRPARGRGELLGLDGDAVREVAYAGGPATIELRAEGFAAWRQAIDVAPGERLELGVVRLARGRAVAGIVVDATGRPVTGAQVLRGSRGDAEPESPQVPVDTGADGRFEVFAVPDDGASLFVTAAGLGEAVVDAGGAAPAPVRVVLVRGGEVRLLVHADDRPLRGAPVDVVAVPAEGPSGRRRRHVTDEDGLVEGCWAPGRYEVTVLDGDGTPCGSLVVDVVEGGRVELELPVR